ncbi:uncharacterized protein [Haliotis cracherodii]|uniref:uncharacterized protein n=1 Tax=Haliotis cracherodii TaxID=6455 RepID=UPI0039EC5376
MSKIMAGYPVGGSVLIAIYVFVLDIVTNVDGASNADNNGLCFRAESLGHREGNLYYCNDPALPLCCEKDSTHTCCKAETARNMNDQLILWGFMALTIMCFGGVYYYFSKEGDYWESPTMRLAAGHMARRFGIRSFGQKKLDDSASPIQRDFDIMEDSHPVTSLSPEAPAVEKPADITLT